MLLILAILLLLATFSTKLAEKLGIPGLIVFLGLGMIFGNDVLNLIYFDDPLLAETIGTAFLIIILFEGGFSTKRELMKIVIKPAFTLATIGVIVTAVVIGTLAYLLLDLSLHSAFLIGAIISSTDAAAVFASLRNKKIEPKTAATLEIESATNDPMAIILTITIIQLIQGTFSSPVFFVVNLGWQILAGSLIGYLIGKVGPYIINKAKLETGGFYLVLTLGLCFLSYGLASEIKGNGFLAVFITGYLISNSQFVYKNSALRFVDGLSSFSQVMLFLMLGLLVSPSKVLLYWQDGIIISLILIFIARPVAVFLLTIFWDYSLRQKIFLCWGGIKGAVPIVLAVYPFAAGLEDANYYFNIVFFVVLLSALIQGATLDLLAGKLKLFFGKKKPSVHSLELISLEESGSELIEYNIKKESELINKKIYQLLLPKHSLVTAIVRNKDIVTPRGNTVLKAGDTLFLLTRMDDKEALLAALEPEKDVPEEDNFLNKSKPIPEKENKMTSGLNIRKRLK